MCGIHACISKVAFQAPSAKLKHLLCERGPDYIGEARTKVHLDHQSPHWVSCTSTVLALRGGRVTAQPFQDVPSGSILCWNGEAWKIDGEVVSGNDGQVVFDMLLKASDAKLLTTESRAAVLKVLRSISGPFAFVYLDGNHGLMYFGRDCLGRRSLLFNTDGFPTSFELSSCSDHRLGGWHEVEADGIYQISFSDDNSLYRQDDNIADTMPNAILPIYRQSWEGGRAKSSSPVLGVFNRSLPSATHVLNSAALSVSELRQHLQESLKLRVLNVPEPPASSDNRNARVAVLFSGGLDCTVLARMAHDLLPPEQHIDLINVAFENPRVIEAARKASESQRQRRRGTQKNLEIDAVAGPTIEPPLTTSFEACPDRETGRKAFRELQTVCPGRLWKFVAVDVPYTETIEHRAKVINLIHPHNTEMDLSIAYALYFASRGQGLASSSLDPKPISYSTPARVLLSGLGADELFGGYTRHATAFNRNGFAALLDELELDVNRLGKRNLGRDDRVISHWGREARFPYIDESLVKWAVECPIALKCGFRDRDEENSEDLGIEPGKLVLRLLAYELGLKSVAYEKKRAIQFGARTAKMEIGRTKGTTMIS
ncbi:asparagine synthase-domain-containing protein [Halenospora varia]|nr:asparagine synthase-domain-containing protein [Halenospora varia]